MHIDVSGVLHRRDDARTWEGVKQEDSVDVDVFGVLHCRDDARTVLVAMVVELGPQYLCYAIDTLRSALPRRGYMGHVQGYTVHALLAGLMKVCDQRACPLYAGHGRSIGPSCLLTTAVCICQ